MTIPRMLRLAALGTVVIAASIGLLYSHGKYKRALLSPGGVIEQALEGVTRSSNTIGSQKPKIVYGFLPYWTIKTAQIPPELTHVGYFSITIDENGNIVTRDEDGNAELGWYTYSSASFDQLREKTTQQTQKLEVLITMMNADEIASFLTNPTARKRFQDTLNQFVRSQPVDGVNIDIEYAGDVTDELRTAYAAFIAETATTLDAVDPELHLSIDVFADTASRRRIWDIPAIAPHVDHIVVMAYDFFRSSSPQSGPVAPIFGSEKNRWDTDIVENLKLFIEQAPPEKILLGIPFYGYEWQTVSGEPGSLTYPRSGGIATYKRVQELVSTQDVNEHWDADALAPYVVYTENGKTQTIFYENSRSLSYKLDLVNHTGLGGIAIWALGYEGDTRELWEVIGKKL